MNGRELAFLAIRLIALWIFAETAVNLPNTLYLMSAVSKISYEAPQGFFDQNIYIITVAARLIVSAVLFYAAGTVSRMLVSNPAVEVEPSSSRQWMRVGLMLIGAYAIVIYLPGITNLVIERLRDPNADMAMKTSQIVANVVGIALAAFAVIWGLARDRRESAQGTEG